MGEPYVRPVTAAREPAPQWHAVWRFRAVALVLLVLLALATLWGVNKLLHAADQDPTPLQEQQEPTPAPQSGAPVLPES